jgi:hypothetical protein
MTRGSLNLQGEFGTVVWVEGGLLLGGRLASGSSRVAIAMQAAAMMALAAAAVSQRRMCERRCCGPGSGLVVMGTDMRRP